MTRYIWMRAAAAALAATPFAGAAAQAVDPAMIEAERAAIAKTEEVVAGLEVARKGLGRN